MSATYEEEMQEGDTVVVLTLFPGTGVRRDFRLTLVPTRKRYPRLFARAQTYPCYEAPNANHELGCYCCCRGERWNPLVWIP